MSGHENREDRDQRHRLKPRAYNCELLIGGEVILIRNNRSTVRGN